MLFGQQRHANPARFGVRAERQLFQAIADEEVIHGEKKVSDAAFNERLKRTAGQITELAKKYNKGSEPLPVDCDIIHDGPRTIACVRWRRLIFPNYSLSDRGQSITRVTGHDRD